jgi:hypothetical protein
MMLWLLATFSVVVTTLWGIAHRLKAGSTASADERRFVNLETGHCSLRTQNPEPKPRHNTH